MAEQKQKKAGLTISLGRRPKVLLLGNGMNRVYGGASWAGLLEKINREEKTTILMVTHDITLVNKHRKRTIALEAGHIVADMNEGGYIKHD